MIRSKTIAASMVVLATPSLAAYAPPEPVKSGETIVVTGQKSDKKAVRTEAVKFMRTVAVLPEDGQYARRKDPICAKVFGLDAQYNEIVEKRIRDVAQAVDAPLAKPDCKLNLVVRFSEDADAYIKKAKALRPQLFSTIPIIELPRFYASTAPVRWWYNLYPTDGSGRDFSIQTPQSLDLPLSISSKGFARNTNSSVIDTNLIVNIQASTVVIDIDKVTGFPLDTIASYAAVLSLGHIRQDADYNGAPSVLGIFNVANTIADAPRDLTDWDYAYLRALYKTPLNRVARTQRSKIATGIANALAGEYGLTPHPK